MLQPPKPTISTPTNIPSTPMQQKGFSKPAKSRQRGNPSCVSALALVSISADDRAISKTPCFNIKWLSAQLSDNHFIFFEKYFCWARGRCVTHLACGAVRGSAKTLLWAGGIKAQDLPLRAWVSRPASARNLLMC
jgi:hypothetical protein